MGFKTIKHKPAFMFDAAFDLLSKSFPQILVTPQTRRAGLCYPATNEEVAAELPTLLLGFKCKANLLGKFALIRTLVVWPEIPYLDIN
jgi:hypothetical protein